MKFRHRSQTLTANAKVRRRNPLRADPTRLAGLRRRFVADLRRRFAVLRRDLVRLIVDEDAFGLRSPTANETGSPGNEGAEVLASQRDNRAGATPAFPTLNQRWRFATSAQQVRAFQAWLRQQARAGILGGSGPDLWQRYVEEGFRKGAARAFDDVNRRAVAAAADDATRQRLAGGREQFLRSAFGQPVAVEKVELLASRVYTDLEGVTEDMGLRMTRALTDGLVQGQSPRSIASDLVDRLDISRGRAETIAQTETSRAHSEGQLLALENLGVEELGVMVEWIVTDDERLCEQCAALKGVVLKIDEAKGMLPIHPRCRCSWVPANVGEPKGDQVRGKSRIDRALDAADAEPAVAISRNRPSPVV